MEIKDLIIFLLIFIVVLWLQHNDDKKFNKPERVSLFDKIKLPLVVALLILIIKDFNCKISENFETLFTMSENNDLNNFFSNLNFGFNTSDRLNDIYLGPPDF
jgi:hypothetical protein